MPSLGHDFVIDDAYYIGDNDAVTRGAPLADYFFDRRTTASRADFTWQSYRPVRTVAFRALVAAFGVRPLPFGVANLVLYADRHRARRRLALRVVGDRAAALAATALWALLPVHVEPVAYASALGDQLSLVLQLLALAAAARAIGQRAPRRRRRAGVAGRRGAGDGRQGDGRDRGATARRRRRLRLALARARRASPRRRRRRRARRAHARLPRLRTRVIGAVGQGAITALTRASPCARSRSSCGSTLVIAAPLGHAAAYAAVPLSRARAAIAWIGVAAVAVALWRARRATSGAA